MNDVFAVTYQFKMKSGDMAPMYEIGQTIMVDPKRLIQPGKGVVLFKADRSKFIVRKLERSSQTQWVVRKYGDDYRSGKCPRGTEEKLLREEWPIAEFIQGWCWE